MISLEMGLLDIMKLLNVSCLLDLRHKIIKVFINSRIICKSEKSTSIFTWLQAQRSCKWNSCMEVINLPGKKKEKEKILKFRKKNLKRTSVC